MESKYILDENNNPVAEPDVVKWGQWFETSKDKRIVRQENVGNYRVSTVFLGLNHRWDDGPPLLWETMVFAGDSRSDIYCDRYSSYDEAVEGHKTAVKWAEERANGRTEHA